MDVGALDVPGKGNRAYRGDARQAGGGWYNNKGGYRTGKSSAKGSNQWSKGFKG